MSEFAPPDTTNPDLVTALGAPEPAVAQALHPEGLGPQATMGETIGVLHLLPHLAVGDQHFTYAEGEYTGERIEHASFPISRIVGIASFDSWAGRGLNARGDANQVGLFSSAGTIHYYSQREAIKGYEPEITVFKDNQGEVWGTTILDGSHRTAAAKIKGGTALVCTVTTDEYDRLPLVDVNVGELILQEARQRGSFIGRTILNRQVKRLAAASEKVEQAFAHRPYNDEQDYI